MDSLEVFSILIREETVVGCRARSRLLGAVWSIDLDYTRDVNKKFAVHLSLLITVSNQKMNEELSLT